MNCALILSFCWPKNLKIIWKFSLSQYRCHKTRIDVENCVKSALNSNHVKQNFTVITIWGTLDSLPPLTCTTYIWPMIVKMSSDLMGAQCASYSLMLRPWEHHRRGGDQNSSTGNHCHPNVFCGKRAPQMVITNKFCFLRF